MAASRRRRNDWRRAASSALSGVTNSAAADGVAARWSATRSGDRDIHLMANTGYDRYVARGDGAGHDLFVECPEVFERTAATSKDQDIAFRPRTRQRESPCDFGRRTGALYGDRIDQHRDAGETPAKHTDNVPNRGTRW